MTGTGDADKRGPTKRDDGQLNLKLGRERSEVLKAAVFVRGAGNLTELVLPLLDSFVEELKADQAVKLALEARQLHEARKASVVRELSPREANNRGA